MTFTRRTLQWAMAVLALLTATTLPQLAYAQSDEEAVARTVEAFRAAQFNADAATLTSLSAPELSYSHSDGRIEDRATFVSNATSGKSKFLALAYRNPSIRVVGNTAVVRFTWVGEQQAVADGSKTATHLHILMLWQKQNGEWKLLARGATKLPPL